MKIKCLLCNEIIDTSDALTLAPKLADMLKRDLSFSAVKGFIAGQLVGHMIAHHHELLEKWLTQHFKKVEK